MSSSLSHPDPSKLLAGGILALAVLDAASMMSIPAPDRRVGNVSAGIGAGLIAVHAALYLARPVLRFHLGAPTWAIGQAALLFGIISLGVPLSSRRASPSRSPRTSRESPNCSRTPAGGCWSQ